VRGREVYISFGPLESPNLKHCTSIRISLSKGPNKIGVSLSSPGEGNRSNFQFLIIPDDGKKAHKPRDSEY
jgi:hypothetical protein